MIWTPEQHGPFLIPVDDAPRYAVTDLGHVVNLERKYKLTPALNQSRQSREARPRSAYFRVSIPLPGIWDRKIMVHRLICQAFHGPAPTPNHQVAHQDGNPRHNLPGNLSWKTPRENAADKVRHGTQLFGEQVRNSVLTVADVRRLRQADIDGSLNVAVEAQRLGCDPKTVRNAVSGKTWRWFPDSLHKAAQIRKSRPAVQMDLLTFNNHDDNGSARP